MLNSYTESLLREFFEEIKKNDTM